jgi:hypothetical protein
MFLDAVELAPVATPKKATELEAALAQWSAPPLSQIGHHGARCCDAARSWLLGMDVANRGAMPALVGPRWIRGLYKWGPSRWPIYWCEAVREKTLDCGALAWMTREVLRARGLSCFLAQSVQRYGEETTSHWAASWHAGGQSPQWVRGGLVYHEICAIAMPDGTLRLWDPSAGWWLEESVKDGYGSLAALRIADPTGELYNTPVSWAGQTINAGIWALLKTE